MGVYSAEGGGPAEPGVSCALRVTRTKLDAEALCYRAPFVWHGKGRSANHGLWAKASPLHFSTAYKLKNGFYILNVSRRSKEYFMTRENERIQISVPRNEVSLKNSHVHSFLYHLRRLCYCKGTVQQLWQVTEPTNLGMCSMWPFPEVCELLHE